MSNNRSSRHHYVPQFLIKKFTDENGLLFVYDKARDIILKQQKSPKSIFFDWDRNAVDFSGTKKDNLESLYSALDDMLSKDLDTVLKSGSITSEQLTSLLLLATIQKWRVPNIDKNFDKIKDSLTQEKLGIKISFKGGDSKENEKMIEHLQKSEIFKASSRTTLPFLPLRMPGKLIELHNHSFINVNDQFPSLIGDCTILEKSNSDINEIENFVFPLSSSHTLIFKKGTRKRITNGLFYIQRNLAIIQNSTKYVGCRNLEYLKEQVEVFRKVRNDGKLNDINKFLFNCID